MLKPSFLSLFLSKSIRVHLKFIKSGLINQLPSTRCSFTATILTIADLDPRLSISFSRILRLVTIPE
ncbi:uncharacterized protein M421DRAFT_79325 [Didymella exigua CBS 183.55]|uniref:Uncharacterized protein n=1 Tax=Didymella exigua CBS 183.55 TaxID=1150837 RepID=A0A6A5R4R6_9PLEO|nr:uncharacterized protein M421DRAFT_79325 [Didymella exigua CBS 183.55]KAF1922170.1 hypothetical protein M421DRAFT_79325 [Didymella exigua CBS 183.55]